MESLNKINEKLDTLLVMAVANKAHQEDLQRRVMALEVATEKNTESIAFVKKLGAFVSALAIFGAAVRDMFHK